MKMRVGAKRTAVAIAAALAGALAEGAMQGSEPRAVPATAGQEAGVEGTWTSTQRRGWQVAATFSEDRERGRVSGLICTKYQGASVGTVRFGPAGDTQRARIRSEGNTLEIVETSEDWETTHAFRFDPSLPNRLLYDYVRDGDAEGEGGQVELHRTNKKTCAQALGDEGLLTRETEEARAHEPQEGRGP